MNNSPSLGYIKCEKTAHVMLTLHLKVFPTI